MIRFVLSALLLAVSACALAQPASLDEVRRLVREGRLDEALTAIDARLAAQPKDRQTRFLKGVVLAERQDADAAIDVFTGLTRDYPQLPEPYNNLAVLYAARGDYEAARDALLKAINTHPSYATAHENLGDIYAKMAGLAYSRALSLDTANSAAKQKLALIDDLFTRDVPDHVMVAQAASPPPTPAAAPVPSPPPARKPARAPAPVTAPAAPPARAPVMVAAAPPPRAAAPRDAVASEARPAQGRDTAIAAIQAWAAAWSAQDVDRYLGAYVDGVSPEPGLSREAWEQQRRERLTRPSFIDVDVDNFRVRDRGDTGVEVTFVQSYRSNTFSDRVRKQLTMEHTGEGWKISEERTVAKL